MSSLTSGTHRRCTDIEVSVSQQKARCTSQGCAESRVPTETVRMVIDHPRSSRTSSIAQLLDGPRRGAGGPAPNGSVWSLAAQDIKSSPWHLNKLKTSLRAALDPGFGDGSSTGPIVMGLVVFPDGALHNFTHSTNKITP